MHKGWDLILICEELHIHVSHKNIECLHESLKRKKNLNKSYNIQQAGGIVNMWGKGY